MCGRVSGRDVEDKVAEAGLHPYYVDGTTAVEEADWYLCAESFMRRICCQNVSQMKNVIQDGIRRKIITPCIWQRS